MQRPPHWHVCADRSHRAWPPALSRGCHEPRRHQRRRRPRGPQGGARPGSPATHALPPGAVRDRYRFEHLAELHALPGDHQNRYAVGALTSSWTLRRALLEEWDVTIAPSQYSKPCSAASISTTTGNGSTTQRASATAAAPAAARTTWATPRAGRPSTRCLSPDPATSARGSQGICAKPMVQFALRPRWFVGIRPLGQQVRAGPLVGLDVSVGT